MKVPSLPILKPPSLPNLQPVNKEVIASPTPSANNSDVTSVYTQLVSIQRTVRSLHNTDQQISSLETLLQSQCARNMHTFRPIQREAVTRRCIAGLRVVVNMSDVAGNSSIALDRRCRAVCVAIQALSRQPEGVYAHRQFIAVSQRYSMAFYKFVVSMVDSALACMRVVCNHSDMPYVCVSGEETQYTEFLPQGSQSNEQLEEVVNGFSSIVVTADLMRLRDVTYYLRLLEKTWEGASESSALLKRDFNTYLSLPFPKLVAKCVAVALKGKLDTVSSVCAYVSVRDACTVSRKLGFSSAPAVNLLNNVPRVIDMFLESSELKQLQARYSLANSNQELSIRGDNVEVMGQLDFRKNVHCALQPAQQFGCVLPNESLLEEIDGDALYTHIQSVFSCIDTVSLGSSYEEITCNLLLCPLRILQMIIDPPLRHILAYDSAIVKPLRVHLAMLYQAYPVLRGTLVPMLTQQPTETIVQRVVGALSYIQTKQFDQAIYGNTVLVCTGGIWSWIPADSEYHEDFLLQTNRFDMSVLQFCRGPVFQFVLLFGIVLLWLSELLCEVVSNTGNRVSSHRAMLDVLKELNLSALAASSCPPIDECDTASAFLVLILLIKLTLRQCVAQIESIHSSLSGGEMLVSIWSSQYVLQLTAYLEDTVMSCIESFSSTWNSNSSNIALYQQCRLMKSKNVLDLTVVSMNEILKQIYGGQTPPGPVLELLSSLPRTSTLSDSLIQQLHCSPSPCSLPVRTVAAYKHLRGIAGSMAMSMSSGITVLNDSGQWSQNDVVNNAKANLPAVCREHGLKFSLQTNEVPLFSVAAAIAGASQSSSFPNLSSMSSFLSKSNNTLSYHVLTGSIGEVFKILHEVSRLLLQFAESVGSTRVVVPSIRAFLSIWAQVTMTVSEGCWDLNENASSTGHKVEDYNEFHQPALQWVLGQIRASGGVGHETRCETLSQVEEQQQQVLQRGVGKILKSAELHGGAQFPRDGSVLSELWLGDLTVSSVDKVMETVIHSSIAHDEEWTLPDWTIALTWLRSRATATLLDPSLKFSKVKEARTSGALRWLTYKELCCGLLSLYTESHELRQCLQFVQTLYQQQSTRK